MRWAAIVGTFEAPAIRSSLGLSVLDCVSSSCTGWVGDDGCGVAGCDSISPLLSPPVLMSRMMIDFAIG